jgi:hypothetical protein
VNLKKDVWFGKLDSEQILKQKNILTNTRKSCAEHAQGTLYNQQAMNLVNTRSLDDRVS